MKIITFLICLIFFSFSAIAQKPSKFTGKGITNKLYRYKKFQSAFAGVRIVDVWLPLDYSTEKKYSVLYMHDGQNLFDPRDAYNRIEWGVDETLQRLINEGKVRDTIVVGIWNTRNRIKEFSPERAFTENNVNPKNFKLAPGKGSDNYLKFIVQELKPFIDKNYSTLSDRDNTFVMGSSMGGLMSLYAISEYPETFGGAAGVSTHFPLGDGIIVDYLKNHLPSPKNHKIYYDYGTIGLDALYEPYQIKADQVMKSKGFTNKNWMTRKFPGGDHTELSWSKRVDIPLTFLLGKN